MADFGSVTLLQSIGTPVPHDNEQPTELFAVTSHSRHSVAGSRRHSCELSEVFCKSGNGLNGTAKDGNGNISSDMGGTIQTKAVSSTALALSATNDKFESKNAASNTNKDVPLLRKTGSRCSGLDNDVISTPVPDESLPQTPNATDSTITDTRFGWFVVAMTFVNCYVIGSMFIAFSILYIEFSDNFNANKATAGWIGSLYMAIGNICGIFFSVFIDRYGCRLVAIIGSLTWFVGFGTSSLATNIAVLYLTYGIIAGIGASMVLLPTVVIVQQHFRIHRPLAASLSSIGYSVGAITAGPLVRALIDTYGWRGTMLMLAAIVLNCSIFASFYRPPTKVKSGVQHRPPATKAGNGVTRLCRELVDVSVFRNVPFCLLCLSMFVSSFGFVTFSMHTPSRAYHLGIVQYSLLPTVNGVASAVARGVSGVIANCRGVDRVLQNGCGAFIAGVFLAIIGVVDTFVSMAAISALTAFFTAFYMTIQPTVLTDIVGIANTSRAMAFLFLFSGVGSLLGIPTAGFIFDVTRNYSIPFFVGGSIQILGGCLGGNYDLFPHPSLVLRELTGCVREQHSERFEWIYSEMSLLSSENDPLDLIAQSAVPERTHELISVLTDLISELEPVSNYQV